LQKLLQAGTTGFFKQDAGPHHISPCKGSRVKNRPIDVRLRRSIDHPFNSMLTEETFDQGLISNVPMHKCMPGMGLDRLEICEIAGVFQRIEIHHLMAALQNQATHEMRADESSPAGYEDSHLRALFGLEARDSLPHESYNLFAPVFATS
jgi:hypothetical protein